MNNYEIHKDKHFLKSIISNNMINGGIAAPKIRTFQNFNLYFIHFKIASLDYTNYSILLKSQYLIVEVKSIVHHDNIDNIPLYSFVFYLPKEISEGEVRAVFYKKELIIELKKGGFPVKSNIQIPIIKKE